MMILGNFKFYALGIALVGLAASTLAGTPVVQAVSNPKSAASAGNQSADANRSRRVELPFPLDSSSPDRQPRAASPRDGAGRHPYREIRLQRAAFEQQAPIRPALSAVAIRRKLSQYPDFS